MTALIVYASNSGGTYLTAKLIRDSLESFGTKVFLKKAKDTSVKDLEEADLILIGSPSWYLEEEGRPHGTIVDFMEKFKDKDFSSKNFALFGCGDRSYLHFCGAVDELEEFVKGVKGKKMSDSLKIDGFFFDLEGSTVQVEKWAKSLGAKIPVSSIV